MATLCSLMATIIWVSCTVHFCSTMPHLPSPFSTPLMVFLTATRSTAVVGNQTVSGFCDPALSFVVSPLFCSCILLDYPYTLACCLPSFPLVSFQQFHAPSLSPHTHTTYSVAPL
ncbi:MAG: hypothetical protein J3Q66DRAFT_353757 [Benniella sp.]|nr:MAG: hypothetical protein J3Q66DRAFT_353757 [Benniella sp.]